VALDLGQLSGRLGMDVDPLEQDIRRALGLIDRFEAQLRAALDAAGTQAGGQLGDGIYRGADGRLRDSQNRFVSAADAYGRRAGDAMGAGAAETAGQGGEDAAGRFARGLRRGAAGVALAAGAVGAAGVAGLAEAMSREVIEDSVLGAGLGASENQSRKYGNAAGRVYRQAFGESFEEVALSVEAVLSTLDGVRPGEGLDRLTKQTMTLADQMGADVAYVTQVAQQLIDEGMAKSAEDAFDQMTRASQKTRTSLRGDLLDITAEYAPFFKMLGYDGPQMFALLSEANSAFDMDKTADAIKEFGILVGGDMARTKPVLKGLGLDYKQMSNDLLAGGDKSAKATRAIIDALGEIEDPGKQARTSIELFGAPFEDLALMKVPQLLDALKVGKDALGDFGGAAQDAVDQVGDNATSNFTAFKRTLEYEVVKFIEAEVLPTLSDLGRELAAGDAPEKFAEGWESVRPTVEAVLGWLIEDMIPAVVEGYGILAGAIGGFFDDIGDLAAEHPELAEFAGVLVDGLGWLAEHVLPLIATWADHYLAMIADGLGVAADVTEHLVIGMTYLGEAGAWAAGALLDAFGWAFEQITTFLDDTIGWMLELAGIDNPFDDALEDFRAFRDDADAGLEALENGARDLRRALEMEAEVDTTEAEARIRALSTALNAVNPGIVLGDRPIRTPRVPAPRDLDDAEDDRRGRGTRRDKGDAVPSGRRGYDGMRPAINVERLVAHDYGDFVRQQDQLTYAASGGGHRGGQPLAD
jgi:phage-related minor tail protein